MLQAPIWILASHGDDVTFTIHSRVKIHNLNKKKLKTIYSIKKKKKTNESSRLLPPSMSKTPEKKSKIQDPRFLKPRIERVYIISSITQHVAHSHWPLITK